MSSALNLQRDEHRECYQARAALQIPCLWLKGGYFYCDGHALYLRTARNKCLMIQAFLQAPDHSLSLVEIIKRIHHGIAADLSSRLRESIHKSVHRMLSDTRSLLCERYAHYRHLEWLPYSQADNVWCLYRFSDAYVLDQMFL